MRGEELHNINWFSWAEIQKNKTMSILLKIVLIWGISYEYQIFQYKIQKGNYYISLRVLVILCCSISQENYFTRIWRMIEVIKTVQLSEARDSEKCLASSLEGPGLI